MISNFITIHSDTFHCIQRSCICQMFKFSIPFQTCKMCVWTPSFVTESGSDVAKLCTKISNTICKCRKGFVVSDNDFSTCQCKAGFGKKSGGKVWSQDTGRCRFVCLFVCLNDVLSLPARMYRMWRRIFQQIYRFPLPEVDDVRPSFMILERPCALSSVPNVCVNFLSLQMQIWSQYYWNKDLRCDLQWCETLRCKCVTHTGQSSFYRPTAGGSSDPEAVNHRRHHHDDPQENPTLRHFLPFEDSRPLW